MTAETSDPTQPIQIRREAARTLYVTTPMTLTTNYDLAAPCARWITATGFLS